MGIDHSFKYYRVRDLDAPTRPAQYLHQHRACSTQGPRRVGTNDAMKKMVRAIRDAEPDASKAVMTCEPEYPLMGEGGFPFPHEELEGFDRKYEEISGLRVASSA